MSTVNMTRLGYLLSGLFALFIAFASVLPKLLGLDAATVTLTDLGWPDGYALTIGLIELGCLILYLIPRTSILGAVLFMGLLGGAIATQLRVGNPMLSHTLFGVYLGILMWGGLWLRHEKLRALFPFAKD